MNTSQRSHYVNEVARRCRQASPVMAGVTTQLHVSARCVKVCEIGDGLETVTFPCDAVLGHLWEYEEEM